MQYSMFNLGGMRAGVFFVAAIVAFSIAPVSARLEVSGRVKRPQEVENGIPDLIHSPDPAGRHAKCAGACLRATAHIGHAATLNELLIVQDENPAGGRRALNPMRN
jgi:hypothetical protein